ncbi:hypothetical protein C9374_007857 [Naegleria lovaniensis]|uniref:Uncharacterized protein n=1 Tax=Naegleria lovaniensis TaxID=51637 RepID=A0AA88GJL6_NAELO|nr:uncharacterized protein C9374_007857 [Naegleria lovaniensis]KAG2378709.1 hypothetical protein C9374_007857 [Naegleria lovaniensis]
MSTCRSSNGSKMMVCGNNDYFQCTEQFPSLPSVYKPTALQQNENFVGFYDSIQDMVCGAYYGIILNEKGELYGCGRNEYGELSQHDESEVQNVVTNFKRIPFTHGSVKFIAANYFTSYLVTTDNNVYWSGNQTNSRRFVLHDGFAELKTSVLQGRNYNIHKIETANSSIHFVLEIQYDNGEWELFGSGNCTHTYEDGTDKSNQDSNHQVYSCMKYKGGPLRILKCGGNHTMLLTLDYQLKGAGLNSRHQIGPKSGNYNLKDTIEPIGFTTHQILDITCGENFTVYALTNNELWFSGSCCGNNSDTFTLLTTSPAPFKFVASGYDFVLFVDIFGVVYTNVNSLSSVPFEVGQIDLEVINKVAAGKQFAYFIHATSSKLVTEHFCKLRRVMQEGLLYDVTIQC